MKPWTTPRNTAGQPSDRLQVLSDARSDARSTASERKRVTLEDLEVWRQADILVAWEQCGARNSRNPTNRWSGACVEKRLKRDMFRTSKWIEEDSISWCLCC